MRHSSAALAIIQRNDTWLVQWNANWQAYSLIGGHIEPGESFRECCIREITEELECDASDVDVAVEPYAELRFVEYSKAARERTHYHWQLFLASVSERTLGNLPCDCSWVTPSQIQDRNASDGKPIAEQVARVLHEFNAKLAESDRISS